MENNCKAPLAAKKVMYIILFLMELNSKFLGNIFIMIIIWVTLFYNAQTLVVGGGDSGHHHRTVGNPSFITILSRYSIYSELHPFDCISIFFSEKIKIAP